jgi:hypothetical protein
MWEQYKRTLPLIQLTICMVTLAIYFTLNHLVLLAAVFFAAMQVSAVFGAMWAYRLKRKIEAAPFNQPSAQRMR